MSDFYEVTTARPVMHATSPANLRAEPSAKYIVGQQVRVGATGVQLSWDPTSLAVDNGSTVIKPTDILVGNPGRFLSVPGSVGPVDYQEAVSAAVSSSTSAAFATKVSLTTPALTGTYRVSWEAVLSASSAAVDTEARLFNATDALQIGSVIRDDNNSVTDRSPAGGSGLVVFAGAAKTFNVEWRRPAGAANANIEAARLEIWRVS